MGTPSETVCFLCFKSVESELTLGVTEENSLNIKLTLQKLINFAKNHLEISMKDLNDFLNGSLEFVFCQNCETFVSDIYELYEEMCRISEKLKERLRLLSGFLEIPTRNVVSGSKTVKNKAGDLRLILAEHCKLKCNLKSSVQSLSTGRQFRWSTVREEGDDDTDDLRNEGNSEKNETLDVKLETGSISEDDAHVGVDRDFSQEVENAVGKEEDIVSDAMNESPSDREDDYGNAKEEDDSDFNYCSASNKSDEETCISRECTVNSDLEETPKTKKQKRQNEILPEYDKTIKNRLFTCDLCGKEFTRSNYVNVHKERKHGIPLPPKSEKPYSCDICPNKYKSMLTLRGHIVRIHKMNFSFRDKDRYYKGEDTRRMTDPSNVGGNAKCNLETRSIERINSAVKDSIHIQNPDCEEKTKLSEVKRIQEVKKIEEVSTQTSDGNYSCHRCSKTCKSLKGISKHLLDLHGIKTDNIVRPFPCNLCGQYFTRKSAVTAHRKLKHKMNHLPPREKPYTCDLCEKKFKAKFNVKKHMKVVHGITISFRGSIPSNVRVAEVAPSSPNDTPKEFPCKLCPKSYDVKSSLEAHLSEKHSQEPNFKCFQCSLEFSTRRLLSYHVFEVHKKNKKSLSFMNRIAKAKENCTNDGVNEDCAICGDNFRSWDLLRRHLEKHEKVIPEGDKSLKCYFCWRSFAHEQSIWAHLKSSQYHDYTKIEFPCDHADHLGLSQYAFKSTFELEKHLGEDHSDCQILKCSDCGYICMDKNMMDLHRLVHLHRVNLKHRCPTCHSNFLHADTLRDHYNTVHGVNLKLYRCSICSWGFSSKNGYGLHVNSHKDEVSGNKEDIREDKDSEKFLCSECAKVFPTAIQLRDHVRSLHVMKECPECGIIIQKAKLYIHVATKHRGGRHLCPHCGKRYVTLGSLKKHMGSHGEYRYACQFCGKGYATGMLLKRHTRRFHQQ